MTPAMPAKKDWLKFIRSIDDWALCDALIIELEARRARLNPTCEESKP